MINIKHPCKCCKKSCRKNQNSIFCEICMTWTHLKCTSLTLSQFKAYGNDLSQPYYCSLCIAENLPSNCQQYFSGYVKDSAEYLPVDELSIHFDKSDFCIDDLVLLHVNIRSLTKNIDKITELICLSPHQPDIIAITETKLHEHSSLNLVQILGYRFFNNNSTTSAGGTAIYIKHNILCKARTDINFVNKELYESTWIEIENNNRSIKNILIGVIYRHPQNPIKDFTDTFSDLLHKISLENKTVCITGDINIDALKVDKNDNIDNYFNSVHSFGFKNSVMVPTRITEKSSTLIDHFYYNTLQNEIFTSIVLSDISDHFPILISIKKSKSLIKEHSIYKRNYSKLNHDEFKLDLNLMIEQLNTETEICNDNININEKFEMLNHGLTELINHHAPLQKLSRREAKLSQKPWLTSGILKSIQIKNKLYRKLCRRKFKNKELLALYKTYRNKITHLKERSKQSYYHKLLLDNKGDVKKTWKVINAVINKKKNTINLPSKLEIDSEVITNSNEILDKLNNHFASVGKSNFSNKVDYREVSQTLNTNQKNSFILNPTTPTEISQIIKKLNLRKASGYDDISVAVLKSNITIISLILSKLVNESFQTGVYPDCLKIAKVIPIFKGGKQTQPGNYRPISLLSNLDKIIEKLIYNRLISFLNKYNILSDNQYGFRQGHSTTLAISHFYENLLDSQDNGRATCAILLDLSKAFDSVNHDILLFKLQRYGIRGQAWLLLRSYLNNRKQYVYNDNVSSNLEDVEVGVPQGSVLGPLLFLLHINDLQNATKLKVLNFADDTLLYTTLNTGKNVDKYINDELNNVDTWLKNNQLKLNLNKTKYMIFQPHSQKFESLKNLKLYLNKDVEIERVYQYRYLGLIVDCDLNWKAHVKMLKNKLASAVGLLFRVRRYLDNKSLLLTLHTLFISHILYGILCWGRCGSTTMEPIIRLFDNAIKCINFSRDKTISKLYHKSQVLQIRDLFKLELAKFMYKYNHDTLPNYFRPLFVKISNVHSYQTRAANTNYFVPQKKLFHWSVFSGLSWHQELG